MHTSACTARHNSRCMRLSSRWTYIIHTSAGIWMHSFMIHTLDMCIHTHMCMQIHSQARLCCYIQTCMQKHSDLPWAGFEPMCWSKHTCAENEGSLSDIFCVSTLLPLWYDFAKCQISDIESSYWKMATQSQKSKVRMESKQWKEEFEKKSQSLVPRQIHYRFSGTLGS